jgi:hypothetical protein
VASVDGGKPVIMVASTGNSQRKAITAGAPAGAPGSQAR